MAQLNYVYCKPPGFTNGHVKNFALSTASTSTGPWTTVITGQVPEHEARGTSIPFPIASSASGRYWKWDALTNHGNGNYIWTCEIEFHQDCVAATCDASGVAAAAVTANAAGTATASAGETTTEVLASTLQYTCATGFTGSLTYTCGQVAAGAAGAFTTEDSCVATTCDGSGLEAARDTANAAGAVKARREYVGRCHLPPAGVGAPRVRTSQ
jgi:hypothetical protein